MDFTAEWMQQKKKLIPQKIDNEDVFNKIYQIYSVVINTANAI